MRSLILLPVQVRIAYQFAATTHHHQRLLPQRVHNSAYHASQPPSKDSRPLVLLVGWLGAQPRYLAKYANILYTFLLQHMNGTGVFSSPAPQSTSQRRGVTTSHPTRHEYYQSLVSNGALVNNAGGASLPSTTAARGVLSAALATSVHRVEQDWPFALHTLAAAFSAFLRVPYVANNVQQPVEVPQLYLYSRVDAIIPVEDVEAHITTQTKRGVATTAVDFEDSAHCEHFKQYPDKYIELLQAFLAQCC